MDQSWFFIIFIILTFLSGSIPFSVILGKALIKKDIRTYGDGNPGAFNVFRAGGRGIGFFALVLDISKAAIPVGIAYNNLNIRSLPMWLIAISPLLGHVFSPFLKFHGGKALSVALGVWIGLTIWKASFAAALGASVGILITKNTGWAVMLGLLCVLLEIILFQPDPLLIIVWFAELLVLVWTHRNDLIHRPGPREWLKEFFK